MLFRSLELGDAYGKNDCSKCCCFWLIVLCSVFENSGFVEWVVDAALCGEVLFEVRRNGHPLCWPEWTC